MTIPTGGSMSTAVSGSGRPHRSGLGGGGCLAVKRRRQRQGRAGGGEAAGGWRLLVVVVVFSQDKVLQRLV